MILGATRRGAVDVQLYSRTLPCEGKRPQTMNRPHDAGPSVIPVPSFSHSARTRLRSSRTSCLDSASPGIQYRRARQRTTPAYPHNGTL